MTDKDNKISTPSNFGAFVPIEDESDSESVEEEDCEERELAEVEVHARLREEGAVDQLSVGGGGVMHVQPQRHPHQQVQHRSTCRKKYFILATKIFERLGKSRNCSSSCVQHTSAQTQFCLN